MGAARGDMRGVTARQRYVSSMNEVLSSDLCDGLMTDEAACVKRKDEDRKCGLWYTETK